MRCSARQGCATDWRWGDEISMSGAEASLQDPNQGAFGIRGTFQPGRAEVYGGSGVNVQFPGQGESDPDSRKEAGTGYRDGTVPWGHCPGSALFKRRDRDGFRAGTADRAGKQEPESGRDGQLLLIGGGISAGEINRETEYAPDPAADRSGGEGAGVDSRSAAHRGCTGSGYAV